MPLESRSTRANQYSMLRRVDLFSSQSMNPIIGINPYTDEVFVAHFALLRKGQGSWHSFEYAVNNLCGQSVALVFAELFLVYQEVVIRIQLPELAVEDVEVLVCEEILRLPFLFLFPTLLISSSSQVVKRASLSKDCLNSR